MWILGVFLIAYLHAVTSTLSTLPVDVSCESCAKDKSKLAGDLGGNLSVRFTINGNFNQFNIFFNDTNKIIVNEKVVKGNVVTDKRLTFPEKPTKSGSTYSVVITLNRLTTADDKLKFRYEITDSDLNERIAYNEITVIVGPSFLKQPDKELSVEISNKFHVEFSLRSNPKPDALTAKFGDNDMTVDEKQSGQPGKYIYNYQVVGGLLKKEWCGASLTISATTSGKTITSTSKVKLLFAPDIPQNVEANRDADNVLQMIWSPLKYGNCLVRYHVRYSNQNSTVDHRTSESKWVLYKAIGNITVAVNAEVNNKGGIFSEPITILATDPPNVVSPRGKGNSAGLEIEYIIAIVVVVILIILILIGVCVMKYKKGHSSEDDKKYDVDMQPLSQIIPEPDYEFPNIIGKKTDEPQMIYAELGPSGGRTGEKPKVEQSNYAQVKTEGVHYPNIQQSSQYRPASRNSTRSQRSQQRQLIEDNDDNSFGHESSIVV